MLYLLYEQQKRLLQPLATYLENSININSYLNSGIFKNPFLKVINARNELLYEFFRTYDKPEFNIESVTVDNKEYKISETVEIDNTFCELRKFTKDNKQEEVMLIVAPLSGHYSTLLKDTVIQSLQNYDVYVTDWKNCRDIPIKDGDFGFDDYVQYLINYVTYLKEKHKKVNILAVCQPTVPVLCATAMLNKSGNSYPDNVILMGGPVDTRQSPTEVNNYALQHNIDWFKNHVIHQVPYFYKGAGRSVYPGFLQYMGFLSMNMKKHTQAHVDFFNHLLIGADLEAEKHKKFYEEYNSVMDLPAKYYIETLERVFLDQYLAKDKMVINNQHVSLKDISKTAILTIEGEKDDISGPGQTHATIKLSPNLKKSNSITIEGVGHYGIFSGKTWRNKVYPEIKKFIG